MHSADGMGGRANGNYMQGYSGNQVLAVVVAVAVAVVLLWLCCCFGCRCGRGWGWGVAGWLGKGVFVWVCLSGVCVFQKYESCVIQNPVRSNTA